MKNLLAQIFSCRFCRNRQNCQPHSFFLDRQKERISEKAQSAFSGRKKKTSRESPAPQPGSTVAGIESFSFRTTEQIEIQLYSIRAALRQAVQRILRCSQQNVRATGCRVVSLEMRHSLSSGGDTTLNKGYRQLFAVAFFVGVATMLKCYLWKCKRGSFAENAELFQKCGAFSGKICKKTFCFSKIFQCPPLAPLFLFLKLRALRDVSEFISYFSEKAKHFQEKEKTGIMSKNFRDGLFRVFTSKKHGRFITDTSP